jgi:hypothetical protein
LSLASSTITAFWVSGTLNNKYVLSLIDGQYFFLAERAQFIFQQVSCCRYSKR